MLLLWCVVMCCARCGQLLLDVAGDRLYVVCYLLLDISN
jgi:hypothetical protein